MRLRGAHLVLGLAMATSSCATIPGQCVGALVEVGARTCTSILCDDDDTSTVVTDELERAEPEVRREAPAPDWIPGPGACDLATDTAGNVTVACADGTRAAFLAEGADGIVEEHDAPAVDEGCTDGSVVRQGIDVDGDGILEATEVTGRTVECPERQGYRAPTLVGHLAIQGPDDVMRIAGRRALTGGLHIKSARLVRIELPQLQSIGGTLRVESARNVEIVSMPSLASVDGDVVIAQDPALTALILPTLVRVGGSVIAVENPRLSQRDVEELVFRLSRKGFAGPVDLAGNGR